MVTDLSLHSSLEKACYYLHCIMTKLRAVRHQWFVILATWEAEIGRTSV
jgi:hypothetical protein